MYIGKETKYVIGQATNHLVFAFLTGQGIKGAHYSKVKGFWEGEVEACVELVIGGLTQDQATKIAVALGVYFAQDWIYMVRNGEITLVNKASAYNEF